MKKNVLKKFAAAALAAATVMSSMSVMAFADEAETTADTGSVTITKYEGISQGYEGVETNYGAEQSSVSGEKLNNVEFAYIAVGDRVQVDVTDANTGKMTTEMLYTLSNEAVKALGLKDSDKIIENNNTYYRMSTLNEAIQNKKDDVIALVKDKTKDHTGANTKETGKGKTSGDGTIKFDKLSLEKLYLFAETNASGATKVSDNSSVAVTKVSVPFFVSLPFTDEKGNSVKDIYAYPKNSTGTATIDKKIVKNGTDKATTTANIGDTINYKVTYSIPVGENGLESLVVTDTMSKGLTFANNVVVKNGTTTVKPSTEYKVDSSTDNGITTTTITFTSDYCKTLVPNTTPEFTITYTATLNDKAVLGKDENTKKAGNTNDVFVTYRNTGDVDRKTEHKDTKVFTYGIYLLKKGEGTDTVLKNVEFELTDVNGTAINVEKTSEGYYTRILTASTTTSNIVTTDEKGKIYIRGLKPGTYKLTEKKTNAGYVLLKAPVVIEIKDDNATGDATATVGGKTVTMQADQINKTSATAEVPLTVVNSKGFDLPATGGRGIALFTIAGIAIVAAAGSLLFMRKRSK
jgi:fimbrial isopeptide formation D2 family protein/LPXTG-motif cell wall-anchored protein